MLNWKRFFFMLFATAIAILPLSREVLAAERVNSGVDVLQGPGTCGGEGYLEILASKERSDTQLWLAQHIMGRNPKPPFSFDYGGTSSDSFLGTWQFGSTAVVLDTNRTRWTLSYTDPVTGLAMECVATEYHDFPAVEWVVYFENTGSSDTPILSSVNAGDFLLNSRLPGTAMLYHAEGSDLKITDFQPLQTELLLGKNVSFAPFGGRSSDGVLPFFNLAQADNTGIMVGIGWTGQWAASFKKTTDQSVRIKAGMELTHLKLHPGEKIRTPAMLLLFWAGEDRLRGHQQLRQLLLDHYSPTCNGQIVVPPVASSIHGTCGMEATSEQNMIAFIKATSANNLPVDTIWLDAGWYDLYGTGVWVSTGTWEPDPVRFPNGIKPVADAAHSHGFKFLLWFEPERAMEGSWLWEKHPEWLLYSPTNTSKHLNMGNPDALAWAKSKFSGMISDIGIDIYRQDFNGSPPLDHWRYGEPSDRQGITEIRYITGLYEYFDYLRAQHPDLILDNCSSGGRRLDFEMLRRALALTRTDYIWKPDGGQCAMYGLSFWTPVTGYVTNSALAYDIRSNMGAHIAVALNMNDPSLWAPAKARLNELHSVRHLYKGDYYPLTPYSTVDTAWMAWQFDRSDLGQGLVQAFRRPNSTVSQMTLNLAGLDAGATYTLDNLDTAGTWTTTGSELMDNGLTVNLPARGSAIITYNKN